MNNKKGKTYLKIMRKRKKNHNVRPNQDFNLLLVILDAISVFKHLGAR